MLEKFLFSAFFLTVAASLMAQPQPHRERSLGGFGSDDAVAFAKTWDKGCVIVSNNYQSWGGDIDSLNQNYTYYVWLVRLDSARNILWQQKISPSNYSGLRLIVNAKDVIETKDSGIVVIGTSADWSLGDANCWIIKYNKNGSVVWTNILPFQNIIENVYEVKEANDNSLVIAGYKNQYQNSDIGGWMLVLNEDGSIKKDKVFNHPLRRTLVFHTVDITDDGGYLFGGGWDTVDRYSNDHPDLYLLKTDKDGNIQWSKKYGGSGEETLNDVLPVPDGYLIAVQTDSPNDGDISGVHCIGGGSCTFDAWIVKVDKSGNIIWKTTIGDFGTDIPKKLAYYNTHYIVVGYTDSHLNSFNTNKGGSDVWAFELNTGGQRISQAFYGGTGNDYGISVFVDSTYGKAFPYILSTTQSSGQVGGFHDDPGILNESDVWAFKLGYFNTISGTVFYDLNKNGTKENNEPLFRRGILSFTGFNDTLFMVNSTGNYVTRLEGDSYKVAFTIGDTAFSVVPPFKQIDFVQYFNTATADFALQLKPGISDISLSAIPFVGVRPGFNTSYQLLLTNRSGDTVRTGSLYFIKDNRTTYISGSPTPSRLSGDSIIWNYTNLKFSDTLTYNLTLKNSTPPVLQIGDTLKHFVWAPLSNDADTSDNTVLLKQLVRGSFDPNDKFETHEGNIATEKAAKGEYLNYVIRFQNTGTDTAFRVVIRDTLDKALDISSFEMLAWSAPYELSMNNRNLQWTFANIALPDSNSNEKASHGYIAYRVKVNKATSPNSLINNKAAIYFDYNLPVLTNVSSTRLGFIVTSVPGITQQTAGTVLLIPNPASDQLTIKLKSLITGNASLFLYNSSGQLAVKKALGRVFKEQEKMFSLDVHRLPQGQYKMVVLVNDKAIVQSLIVLR